MNTEIKDVSPTFVSQIHGLGIKVLLLYLETIVLDKMVFSVN